MRALLLPCAFALARVIAAQPDFDRNYCGFAPNDSIDLTNDGIPDVVVQGFRSGTDDEPSSSGTCALHLLNLPGTTLVSDLDAQGYRHTRIYAVGDSMKLLDTSRRDDVYIPRQDYSDGSIRIAYWGYGHQSGPVTVSPQLYSERYVFRTVADGKVWHGSFSIEPPVRTDQVRIRVGALMPADQSFVVR